MKTAKYYTDHFNAGLQYAGRDEEGEEMWLGEEKEESEMSGATYFNNYER